MGELRGLVPVSCAAAAGVGVGLGGGGGGGGVGGWGGEVLGFWVLRGVRRVGREGRDVSYGI